MASVLRYTVRNPNGPTTNKTGSQPVSRPVEQILVFFPKGLKNYQKGFIIMENCAKVLEKCVQELCLIGQALKQVSYRYIKAMLCPI